MERSPRELYLDLLKKTLSFALWPEPPVPIGTSEYPRPLIKQLALSLISRVFELKGFQLVTPRVSTAEQREEGRVWPGYADTMIGLKRLDNVQFCIETALKEDIEGDFIETGTWRGGACIFARAVLAANAVKDRKVFVADSFEGLPEPDERKCPADKGDTHHALQFLAVSQDEVENNFKRYGLLDEQVVFLKGFFKETLPHAPMEKLMVLRLDGDMYSSTIDALTSLYPKLSEGGFCIVDDYALSGCRKAVDAFRAANRINSEMVAVDWTSKYWRKSR